MMTGTAVGLTYLISFLYKFIHVLSISVLCPIYITRQKKGWADIPLDFDHYRGELSEVSDSAYPPFYETKAALNYLTTSGGGKEGDEECSGDIL